MRKFGGLSRNLLILIGLGACASVPHEPLRGGVVSPVYSRTEVYRALQERDEKMRTLRGRATVRGGSFRGPVDLVVQEPFNFRFDASSDLGTIQERLVCSGGELVILWPGENRYFRGNGAEEDFDRHLSLPLGVEEIVRFLLTDLQLRDEEEYRLIRRSGDQYILKGQDQEIRVGRVEGQWVPIRMITRDSDGSFLHRVEYQDWVNHPYQKSESIPYPKKIIGKFPIGRFEMDFQEVELNPKIPAKQFDLAIPSDAIRMD